MSTPSKKAIIIGSGIAGLASAARLASRGYDVHVFEKNDFFGGKLALHVQDGYAFDMGPSIFTQPFVLEDLFNFCGKKFSDYFRYQNLSVNTHNFFNDGTVIHAYKGKEKFVAEIREKLQIDTSRLESYLLEAERMYNDIGKIFLDEHIHDLQTWTTARIPKALKSLKWQYLLKSMHDYHQQKLQHPKLVQMFDRFATYNGSNPFEAPAMLSMIAHLEMNDGAYYPEGGMISIPNAVYKLCNDLGVQFHFNSKVERIILEGNKATGIVTNGKEHRCDIVVTNSDVFYSYYDLLQDKEKGSSIGKMERSTSAMIFYWGINKEYKQLNLHNLFFSDNYKEEFDYTCKLKKPYHDPTIYINITSKMEPQHAPAGCENWFVFVNKPAIIEANENDVTAEIKKYTVAKLSRMLGEDITPHIASEHTLTPTSIQSRTNSYLGALYGTASNNKMAAFKRHSNVSSQYKGLYFAGGSVHPGGGIPLCLRSAKLAVDKILTA